ncbi:Fe-S cluster assembly protein SufD [Colwellia sp. MB02u-10]|jgi:Fe-S cluster assembly protein SufD|uniref:Fe-S cluster assembly protein SufD n=1 Tax=Colwellia sp. MB02u-10 TaxID=2759828 RepID=UPI0015F52D33|nr:Fe-S cluster assembly protein SufD [Colwellia sp. MB02u-10]MBA6342216.1 Fe-S cluster assembly protein SufD [Colwellia sp. MB02u-10]
MSQWLKQVIDRGQAIDDWLSPLRVQALEALGNTKWPNRRVESWKYTSLAPLEQLELSPSSTAGKAIIEDIEGLNSLDLVFVNGKLQSDISLLPLPQGLHISSLQDASDKEQNTANALFAKIKPQRHLFGLVNDVLAEDGLIIDIDANSKIEQPIRIVNISSDGQESHHRVLVRLGSHASATVIEHGQGEQASLSTGFAEYDIGEQAYLEHYRLAMHTHQAIHIGGCHFSLQQKAQLNSTLIAYGSELSRMDVDIIHNGEHAKAKFNAIYLLGEAENFDLHSTIEHVMPNGTTKENARGIVGDKAKAVFNGRIHIHRNAQKTLAELHNRNLLLSRRGQINTKPELEIYADDVLCAHGATVAETEEETLYYLLSRGISRSQALVMLNFGFIQELVEQMPNQHLAQWLKPQLHSRFVEMEVK